MSVSGDSSQVSEPAMRLGPLTSPRSRREVLAVVDAYAHFWSHPKFAGDLAAPPFPPEAIMDLLKKAATIVVYIRRHLDQDAAGPEDLQARVPEGGAHEFLWSVMYDPRQDPDRFVRDLVHATLKDAGGYVEDLTAGCIDEFIAEIEAYLRTAPPPVDWLAATGPCGWKEAKALLEEAATGLAAAEGVPERDGHAVLWQSVCASLGAAARQLAGILQAADHSGNPAGAPATPHEERLTRTRNRRRNRKRHWVVKTPEAPASAPKEAEAPPLAPAASHPSTGPVPAPTAATPEASPAPEPPAAPAPQDPTPPLEHGAGVPVAAHTPAPAEAASPPPADPQPTSVAPTEASTETQPTPAEQPAPSNDVFHIKIGKVTEDVTKRQEDLRTLLEASRSLVLDDPALSAQALEQLQKRCLESSESLMRDMLTLDSLVAATPEEKAKRKEQVVTIQSILDSLDDVSEKLRALSRKIHEQKEQMQKEKEEALAKAQEEASQVARSSSALTCSPTDAESLEALEAQRRDWEARQSGLALQRQQSAQQLGDRIEHIADLLLSDAAWKALKLAPRFDVAEQPAAYLLKAFVPDLRTEDIAVDLNAEGTELVVQGARIPTRPQTAAMLEELAYALRSGRLDPERLLSLNDEQVLLVLGSGRYGTFVQRFRLPDDTEPEGVRADYDRGVLKVTIPKRAAPSFRRLFPPPPERRADPLAALHRPYGLYGPAPAYRPAPAYDSLFW